MYGNDFNYAESRLANSIVRIARSGEPVLVEAVNTANGHVTVHTLADRRRTIVRLDDLNLKPVPLGWCNLEEGGATYLARIPKRRDWRQGVRAETCFSSRVIFRRIPFPDLAKCIRGEYPKLADLIKRRWDTLQAWSRKWASDGNDVYFGNLGIVGRMDNGTPVLLEGYTYLKENLEKSLT